MAESNLTQSLTNVSVSQNTTAKDEVLFPFIFDNRYERAFVSCCFLMIFFLGFFGNSLVILSVLFSRKLHTTSNVFVVNLSVADLITCLFIPMSTVQYVVPWGQQVGPDWMCIIVGAMNNIGVGVSVLTLASISLTRALIVTRPLARPLPRCLIICWLLFIWLLPISVDFIYPMLVYDESIYGYNIKYGVCSQRSSHPHILIFNGIAVLIAFPIPFVTIIISFLVIFMYMKRHSSNMMTGKTSSSGSGHSSGTAGIEDNATKERLHRRQVLITKNMLIVVCFFFLCIAPYTLGVVIPGSDPAMPYLAIIILFNSCVNPIIYAKHPTFQEIFQFILNRKWKDIPEKTALLTSILRNNNN